MLPVSSHDLAAALAERLNQVLPDGFHVVTSDIDLIVFRRGTELGIAAALAVLETVDAIKNPERGLETAVRATLDAVQDLVAEATAEPWPGAGTSQPNPDTRVHGGALTLWFGPEEDPVLRLEPVALPPRS